MERNVKHAGLEYYLNWLLHTCRRLAKAVSLSPSHTLYGYIGIKALSALKLLSYVWAWRNDPVPLDFPVVLTF